MTVTYNKKYGDVYNPYEYISITLESKNMEMDMFRVDNIPFDNTAHDKWLSLGIKEERIARTVDDNFWIAGETGPCGPDTEMFYWRSNEPVPEKFDPEDVRWVEIWNDVFMQYKKNSDGSIEELPKKNVDTGMGVERVTAVLERQHQ